MRDNAKMVSREKVIKKGVGCVKRSGGEGRWPVRNTKHPNKTHHVGDRTKHDAEQNKKPAEQKKKPRTQARTFATQTPNIPKHRTAVRERPNNVLEER